ncbi:prenyltransferase [Micromonospora sp. NBC_01699]|uniref:prenyltransferase/squalene oxidase repeat-containing protein n=1 Tax=Micromonospora sp. NBC_01699 TaxID=2975984 RepID=UPI002E27BE18|nr:prenyltransferase/squalene oxidase repeat-containing protein [Micromonospora sp. NBC_01699]
MTTSVVPDSVTDPGDLAGEVDRLLAGLVEQPWGRVAPSVYETARLITLAPWLTGHAERMRFVLAAQRGDGGWGPPGGYALVPTLSAVEALLAVLRRDAAGGRFTVAGPALVGAVDRGLAALAGWLGDETLRLPDTPAIDLIVPALVEAINRHLDDPPARPSGWRPGPSLGLPAGMSGARLVAVRRLVAAGAEVPAKLAHSFEVVGAAAGLPSGILPGRYGTVGASPAATAAWIAAAGRADGTDAARTHLEALAPVQDGPVPCPTPITVFERAWILSGLARAGVDFTAPRELVDSLVRALGPTGTATGPGLPADADTTAVTLYALGHLGVPTEPDSLWGYDTGAHFSTWPGEDGASVSTNAHVLDAFGLQLATRADPDPRYPAVVRRLSAWLREQQRPDGAWYDRWHASPYYATACAVLALREHGRGRGVTEAVGRAVAWVVAGQRPDGSWGRWSGTAEETAYALHVLLGTRAPLPGALRASVLSGYSYLRHTLGRKKHPALWHGKDLYAPTAIVRSATLAAVHLVASRADLAVAAPAPQ